MFFELNDEYRIGYKLLSKADLGASGRSNQTHIGLSEGVLTFLPNRNKVIENSILIYEDSFEFIDTYFDRIERPDGGYRSPKIRLGGKDCISMGRMIREIAKKDETSSWFLIWFGLKNDNAVFFLFNEQSSDYENIINLGLDLINKRMDVLENSPLLVKLVNYLELKVNKNGAWVIKELEVISQVESKPYDKRFRRYDIDKANENFKEIGRRGEQIVNELLDDKLNRDEIFHFTWYNKDTESGLPYDFSVQNNNGSISYIDAKTTNHDFGQKIIFSSQEIDFIASTMCGYSIYRVYRSGQSFCIRICDDCKELSAKINDLTQDYKNSLCQIETDLRTAKFAISPLCLKFKDPL